MENISPWAGFRNLTLRYFMYLILAQIHSHIFNLAHRIRIKINILKTEELLFSNQYGIVQYEIREDQNLRGSKPVIRKS